MSQPLSIFLLGAWQILLIQATGNAYGSAFPGRTRSARSKRLSPRPQMIPSNHGRAFGFTEIFMSIRELTEAEIAMVSGGDAGETHVGGQDAWGGWSSGGASHYSYVTELMETRMAAEAAAGACLTGFIHQPAFSCIDSMGLAKRVHVLEQNAAQ